MTQTDRRLRVLALVTTSTLAVLATTNVTAQEDSGAKPRSPSQPANQVRRQSQKVDPAEQQRRFRSERTLRNINRALSDYRRSHGHLPAAYTATDGKPLLSWRVALLPFLQAGGLHAEFHLDEPWDSDHNKRLLGKMPHVFAASDESSESGLTVYLTPRTIDSVFPGEKPFEGKTVPDGASTTLRFVEAGREHAVPWTKPDDWIPDPAHPKTAFQGGYEDGFYAGFCDGSERFLLSEISDHILNAIVTQSGHENVASALDEVSWRLPSTAFPSAAKTKSLDTTAVTAPSQSGEQSSKQRSVDNLNRIMQSMYEYHDSYNRFPPAYSDKDGKPAMSWRVKLLWYMEDLTLANEYRINEPWDSEQNRKLLERMPDIYRAPNSKLKDGRTVYLTPRGEQTLFPGAKPIGLQGAVDGTTNTIAVIEVDDDHAVPWTKPDDWNLSTDSAQSRPAGQYTNGFHAAFCDGTVRFISDSFDDATVKALFSRNGREKIKLPK